MGEHLGSLDADLNQSQFLRMFALGFFDSLITLPISITSLVANIINAGPHFKFYQGWSAVHSNWDPVLVPKNLWSMDKIVVFSVYWDDWINPFFALVFFTLFGLTPAARKGYRKFFSFLWSPFGVKQQEGTEEGLSAVVFNSERETHVTITSNISSRYGSSTLSALCT